MHRSTDKRDATSDAAVLLAKLKANAYKDVLARLYCCPDDETDMYADRFAGLVADFVQTYGREDGLALFSAPGRTEIGGNHTDHQHGCVVAGSVNLDIAAVAAPNGTNRVRMLSDGQTLAEVNLDRLRPDAAEKFTSGALIRGIAACFAREGYRVGGVDIVAGSTVLKGSGLSSSAAFEVLIANIMNSLFCDGEVGPVELAKFGRHAENVFFGKPCGLMDQLASSVGGFLFIDFADVDAPAVDKIDFDLAAHGHALCIIDSGGSHADLSDVYASIPEEMRRVAAYFGKTNLREVEFIDFTNNIMAVRRTAGDRAYLRALHFFHDNERAQDEALALKAGDFDRFLALVRDSGRSSSLYLQNAHVPGAADEQAVDVALAVCTQILHGRGACRVHGGGFAGTIQAFVPVDMHDDFVLEIEAALGAGSCHSLSIRPDGGMRLA